MDLHSIVKTAELDLLASGVRRDEAVTAQLLSPDFREIGRSGHLWSRAEIVTALENRPEISTSATDEWVFTDLALGLVLVTYRIRVEGQESRHSSLWDTSGDSPCIRFHQGTTVAGR